jgi:glycosyltransferase involved in cell wall biosynthesis
VSPPLRLAFDATSLLGPRTGVGVVAQEVLSRVALDPDTEVVAFAATWRGRAQLSQVVPAGVRAVSRPMAARPLRMGWGHLDAPPIEWWTGRVDVVHSPNYVVPPSRRGAELMSVHDLTFVRFPELCTRDTLAYPPLIRRALRRGATIHTGSQFVADEIMAEFGVGADRVVVIAYGVNPLPPDGPATSGERGRELAGGGPYVLALGTVEPRKDLPSLVAAFDAVAAGRPDLSLVIAGPDGWGAAALDTAMAASPHRSRIHRLGFVSDDTRAALLRGASVYAYPSIYEGFGLPPVEAMAAGTPVVTTSAGSLPEVVGDAALVVSPRDADGLGQAIARLLDDPALTHRLRLAGLDRAARYSWDTTAADLLSLYRRLAALHSAV